jgi:serine/threonine-protein kinase
MTEEVRGFVQGRVAMFGKVTCIMSGCFLVLTTAMEVFGPEGWRGLGGASYIAHAATTALLAAIWLLCTRLRLSPTALVVADAGVLTAVGAGFAVMGWFIPRDPGIQFPMILAMTHVSAARAVMVPSSGLRTLIITTVALLPTAITAWFIGKDVVPMLRHTDMQAFMLIGGFTWSALTVATCTVASAVIYGLQRKVEEAKQLGQYTLAEKIGEGGMGVVYRAHHAMLRRPTAIKLLRPEEAGEANLIRFEREVQLTSKLTHPNTVAIFDYGRTPEGVFYYAMEYLDGLSLEELVENDGPQPPARVIHLLRQISGALAEAHGTGLIHRDIKPANIVLCERGGVPDVVKVVDFGLVKDLSDETAQTQANTLAGTPLYLSPESIKDPGSVDARSDLYAVGAVGYYLLTGKHVFDATTIIEVCSHHLHTAPVAPSERLGHSLPDDLESLILSCLEKTPDARPRDARTLHTALARCSDADRWSEEEATVWWATHRRVGPRKSVDPLGATVSRTQAAPLLTVDLSRRAG